MNYIKSYQVIQYYLELHHVLEVKISIRTASHHLLSLSVKLIVQTLFFFFLDQLQTLNIYIYIQQILLTSISTNNSSNYHLNPFQNTEIGTRTRKRNSFLATTTAENTNQHVYPKSDEELATPTFDSKEVRRKNRIKLAINIAAFVVFQIIVSLVFSLIVMRFRTPKVTLGTYDYGHVL